MASASKLFARKLFTFVSIVGKHHLELRGGENFLCCERVLSKREIFSEDLHEKKKELHESVTFVAIQVPGRPMHSGFVLS